MGKDTRLINIYLKIHNKRTLTMDDLRYLAKYSPECFEKTCKNVIYNRPETKPIMDPAPVTSAQSLWAGTTLQDNTSAHKGIDLKAEMLPQDTEQENITQILANLSTLESDGIPFTGIKVNEVKNLLGNLYMEMLFPHNDTDLFFDMSYDPAPRFDRKA